MAPGIAILAAGGITAVAAIVRGAKPSPNVIAGAVIAGGILTAIAAQSPDVAGKYATLVLITAILTSGADIATGISRLVS